MTVDSKKNRLEFSIFIMLVAIIPLDYWCKYLHTKYYDIPRTIIGAIVTVYIIIFLIILVLYSRELMSLIKSSKLLQTLFLIVIFYFALIRRPIGLTQSYLAVDKIVVYEKNGQAEVIETEVKNKFKMYNNLKYSKRTMDYDFGSAEGISSECTISIIYMDGSSDYFYYSEDKDVFASVVTTYKILYLENEGIEKQLIKEGIMVD